VGQPYGYDHDDEDVVGFDGKGGVMEFTLHAALPASDIDRAKAWYSEKLGAEPIEAGPGGELRYNVGGTTFGLYKSDFAGTNQATAAMLAVSDFDEARAELRSRGVVFEDSPRCEACVENALNTTEDFLAGAKAWR
jgi:catechol 2,3-dioxygenase-like lactoylglutathione lyase family enzyme